VKPTMISLKSRLLHYSLAFMLGAVSFWLMGKSQAGIPYSANPIARPIPIKLSKISPEDGWINSFQLYAVPLDKVDSNREYLLLIIKRKSAITEDQLPDSSSRFVFKGLRDGRTELWVSINPSQMKGDTLSSYTLLLDFGGRIVGGKQLFLTENLEMSSMDPAQYTSSPR
jgi:hypothetical protein